MSYWDRFSYLRDKKKTEKTPGRSIIRTKDGSLFVTENGVTRKVDEKVKGSAFHTNQKQSIGFKSSVDSSVDSINRYHDYYHSRHSSRKKKKKQKAKTVTTSKFGFSNDLWRNYSYNNWSFNEDDDDDLLCKDPVNYITPTAKDITGRLPCYSREKIMLVKDLSRFFYFQMVADKDYISKKWSVEHERTVDVSRKVEILKKLEGNYVPGFSPFEKAQIVYYRILDQESSKSKKASAIEGCDNFTFDRDVFNNDYFKKTLEINPFTKHNKLAILEKISLVKHFGREFVITSDVGEERVANSINKKSIRLKEYEDIFYVDLYQKVLPNFNTKFVTKDLNVSVPVETEKKKQKVIILLDESGSMSRDEKQRWTAAILAERFNHVIEDDAEIYFSYFVNRPSDLYFHHITCEEDVTNFWTNVYNSYPSNGATDMGRVVKAVKEEIGRGRFFNLSCDLSTDTPEILIINDGQDNANTEEFGYKVNAISLMEFSDQLKQLCLNSGGRQIRVREDGELLSYSLDNHKEEVVNPIIT